MEDRQQVFAESLANIFDIIRGELGISPEPFGDVAIGPAYAGGELGATDLLACHHGSNLGAEGASEGAGLRLRSCWHGH